MDELFPAKRLGFGLMRLPLTDPTDDGSVDLPLLEKMVDTFLERGFTYFDTAIMYCGGKSESSIGKALVARHPRGSFTLTTKLHGSYLKTEADRDRIFAEQLERTGAGYFDYYLLHDIGADLYEVYTWLDCFRWLQEKKAAGLVHHIGFSFHDSPELLERVLTEHPEMEFVQLQLNYLDWDSAGIASRRCYECALRHGKPVIVMEPVKGGTLARVPESVEQSFRSYAPDASVSSWALRFAATPENVKMVLSGMSTMEQLLDNIRTFTDFRPLCEEEHKLVRSAVDAINKTTAVPCTGCSYCTEGCPMRIAIPRYFSLYNIDLLECPEKDWTPQGEYYQRLTDTFGKASDCIGCGQCEGACPQHLPIITHLKSVAARFEK